MKRFFFACVLLSSSLFANQYFVEVRGAYFYPTDSRTREIYSGGGSVGLEADFQLWREMFGWAGASYFENSGNTIGGNDKTKLILVPITSGLKGIYNYAGMFRPYAGVGIAATYVYVRTDADLLIRSNHEWGVGGVFKVGLMMTPLKDFIFDIFADYLLQTVSFDNEGHEDLVLKRADVSGFSFGGAIGYQF
jgi:hypothetical protein